MSGLAKKIYSMEDWFFSNIRGKRIEKMKINELERRKLYEKVELSVEQKREIDDFYLKHYGKKIPYTWHRYYYAFSGKFDKRYFPELLAVPEFEWLVNPKEYSSCFEDKNIIPYIASGIEDMVTPKVILSCSKGVFRDDKTIHITKEKAKDILKNCDKVFIKPTIETGSGFGCTIIEMKNNVDQRSGKSVEMLLEEYGDNFVVQHCIIAHDSISKIHPSSINTFRVITYRLSEGRIFHTPTIMRIGQGGNFLDNAHVGGMFIGIDNDGYMNDTAYTEYHDVYSRHPDTQFKFIGYKIPLIKRVHEKALEMHARIPQVGMVNWDFTIDNQEKIVLIEANVRGGSVWLPQMAWGKGCFEDNTEEILEFLKEKRKRYPLNY